MAEQWKVIRVRSIMQLAVCIEVLVDGEKIGTGTGFVVQAPSGLQYLVSNRHVIVGRKAVSNDYQDPSNRQPTAIRVLHINDQFETWQLDLPIFDGDRRELWWEHPGWKNKLDLVAVQVPIDEFAVTSTEPLRVAGSIIRVNVPDAVITPGFPLGFHGGMKGMPVAVTGTVATHPDMAVDDGEEDSPPRFLIDSRTRSGLSGAPVFVYPNGQMVVTDQGAIISPARDAYGLLGIYCGRIRADADIGYVIPTSILEELLANPVPGALHPE